MKSWFQITHGNLPEFWKDYESTFNSVSSAPHRYVVLDTETTGLDIHKDRILSIGAVSVIGQDIPMDTVLEIYVKQEVFNPETVKIHGLIKEEKLHTVSELEALKQFLNYIGNAILVAHHAGFDISMLNEALKRHHLPKLKNKVLDTGNLFLKSRIRSNLVTSSKIQGLDAIAENLSIPIQDRHTAVGDAYSTALIFLKLRSSLTKFKKFNEAKLRKLARNY